MNKKRILFVLGLGAIFAALVACGSTTNAASSVVVTPTAKSSAPTPAATPKTFKVGQTVAVDNTWDVTINSVKDSAGSEFNTPTKGTYLLLDVTVKNITSSSQPISSVLNFKLQDASGVSYNETINTDVPNPPDGSVQPGALSRGTFTYDVPKGTKFTFSFISSITATDATTWDVNS